MALPRIGGSSVVSSWMIATAAASIVAMLDGGATYSLLAYCPERIVHGQVWRLLAWVLVEPAPLSMAFTLACIYKFGGELAPRWGERRLRRFMLEIVVGASIAGVVLALVFSETAYGSMRVGGFVVENALIIAWARQYPNSTIQLLGFLRLGGTQLIGFTVGIMILIAAASNPIVWAPDVLATLAAMLYPERWLARR